MSQTNLKFEEIKSENEDIDQGPSHYELLTYPADWTLEVLSHKYEAGDIRVPDTQRQFVWKQPQASRLIESFLLGLPVPPVYLYSERHTENLLVVDGQQRIKSIAYFFSGYFGTEQRGRRNVFRLQLPENSQYAGYTFDTLPSTAQKRLQNSVLRAFIMKQVDPADKTSILHVFERLNTGGTLLNAQEVRNCVYDGDFNKLLKQINELDEWRDIVGRPKPDPRMKDLELILRFLSLYYRSDSYTKPMKDFMSKFMYDFRNGEDNTHFQRVFKQTCSRIIRTLGKKPFHLRAGLNAPVFDAISVAFALNPNANDQAMQDRYYALRHDKMFEKYTAEATTDEDAVRGRINRANLIMFGTGHEAGSI